MPRRDIDPFASFNFLLEIDAVSRAGFNECTGLNGEADVIEYREGNETPLTQRKQPGLFKYGNITLKHGISSDTDLFDWIKKGIDGDVERQETMSIVLLNEKRDEVKRWNLSHAWPCKWTGPDLKAGASEIAFESIEICHEGVEVG